MNLTLINLLASKADELKQITENVVACSQVVEGGQLIVETADAVLANLADKLNKGQLQPNEIEDFARIYAGLTMLSQDATRKAFKVDTSTPQGKENFSRLINGVGTDSGINAQIGRVATLSGENMYNAVKRDLENFQQMNPEKKMQYINGINKLRIGYERARTQLSSGSNQGNNQQDQQQDQQQGQEAQPQTQQQDKAQAPAQNNPAPQTQTPAATPQSSAGGTQ